MNICIECLCVSCGRMALKKKEKRAIDVNMAPFQSGWWLIVVD